MNRSRFASLGAVVAIALGASVGGPASMALARHHCRHHHHCHHHSGIPQNNGGDHDSDNSGAASDGDGNL
ncbi:MAG TPA: hypothetical protein VF770_01530 [Solirubrobacterales bacterium]